MGRHSAPDDGAGREIDEAPTAPVITAPAGPGRHARADGGPAPRPAPRPAPSSVGGAPFVPSAPASPPPAPAEPPPEAPDDAPTVEQPAVPAAAPDAAPPAAPATGKKARPHSTATDLALVRAHGDVRARVAAAVVVPFVIYAVVLVAVGLTLRQGLLWIFAPLVVAGVLVGFFLDAGHKRHAPPGGRSADH